ncbi:hypothetical protein DPMN_170131 [Dreissena polymorpha]|uniref:Uncharacterized protein n=1 Tax=Dreissena polymorpha TaxID=45954 RepID=A0A9D4DYY0_DREPO|nr:hypothetical protein DPMN_170131 [Dreissena polymorpha]
MMFNTDKCDMIRINKQEKSERQALSHPWPNTEADEEGKVPGCNDRQHTLLEQPYRLNSKEGELNNCLSPPELMSTTHVTSWKHATRHWSDTSSIMRRQFGTHIQRPTSASSRTANVEQPGSAQATIAIPAASLL